MPNRELMSIEEFRRAVFSGLSPATLNEDLKYALRERCHATPVREIVEALVGVVPAGEAQDYYNRALIGLAVNDYATPQEYLSIAKTLIAHGADPEAYENACRQLAGSSAHKSEIHALFSDVIEAREAERDRQWQKEFNRRRQPPIR